MSAAYLTWDRRRFVYGYDMLVFFLLTDIFILFFSLKSDLWGFGVLGFWDFGLGLDNYYV